jgi:hypothetical protein
VRRRGYLLGIFDPASGDVSVARTEACDHWDEIGSVVLLSSGSRDLVVARKRGCSEGRAGSEGQRPPTVGVAWGIGGAIGRGIGGS